MDPPQKINLEDLEAHPPWKDAVNSMAFILDGCDVALGEDPDVGEAVCLFVQATMKGFRLVPARNDCSFIYTGKQICMLCHALHCCLIWLHT
jgi:hypothetical protein